MHDSAAGSIHMVCKVLNLSNVHVLAVGNVFILQNLENLFSEHDLTVGSIYILYEKPVQQACFGCR